MALCVDGLVADSPGPAGDRAMAGAAKIIPPIFLHFVKFVPMGKRDKRIDAFIAKAEPFAQPILTHIRELVHEACPDVVETIKWGMPHFDYMGIM